MKLAINKRTGDKVAVKVIDKTKMSDLYKKNLQMETDILRKGEGKKRKKAGGKLSVLFIVFC